MCPSTFKVIIILLAFLANSAFAIDTSAEEATCAEIGFKRKTESFANCVLELVSRKSKNSLTAPTASTNTPANPDDALCQRNGFKPGTNDYSQCRLQINNAKALSSQQAQAAERQRAEARRQGDINSSLDLMALGGRMMAGQSPYALQNIGSALNGQVAPPIQQDMSGSSLPRVYNLPGGRSMTCTTMGSVTNCN